MAISKRSLATIIAFLVVGVSLFGGTTLLYYGMQGSSSDPDQTVSGPASPPLDKDNAPDRSRRDVETLLGEVHQAQRELERITQSESADPPSTAENGAPSIEQQVEEVVQKCEAILDRGDATDQQLSRARRAKLVALCTGAVHRPARFDKSASTYCQLLIDEISGSDEAAHAIAYRFAHKYFVQKHKIDNQALIELIKFARKYPESRLVVNLFRNAAQQQLAQNNSAGAVKIVKLGIKACANHPNVQLLSDYFDKLQSPRARETLASAGAPRITRFTFPSAKKEYPSEQSRLLGMQMMFHGPTIRGGTFSSSAYHGNVLLVDFWATWCGPCRREMPTIRRLYEQYRASGLAVVGVSLDTDRDKLADFVQSHDLSWPQVFVKPPGDSAWENPIALSYDVDSIPKTFLVNRRGKIVAIGLRGQDLEDAIISELSY